MSKAPRSTVTVSPLMVIAGEELLLRMNHLEEIRFAVLGDGDPGMALVRLDGAATDMATVLDEVRTPSMFSPRKLVVVDPADPLLKTKEEEEEAPAKGRRPALSNRELLEAYLEASAESGVLVLVCTSWLKTTRLHKALDKLGAVRWALTVKPGAVPSWLVRRARETHGKTLEPAAAARLADLIGPDLQRLDNELAKLALYRPEAPAITVAAVDALVGFQYEQEIWEMIDALAGRDARTALRKVDQLWQMQPKEMDFSSTAAVFYWLNQVLRAREMTDRGLPDGLIIRDLKLWPADRAGKVLALARLWGLDGAARWSRELLYLDLANKSGLGEPRRNLEKFIVQLCA